VNKTPQDHEDYQDLAECSKKISELARTINDKKKSFKKMQKMWMIHNKLTYPKSSDVDKLKRARDKRKVVLSLSLSLSLSTYLISYLNKMMNLVKPSRELVKKGAVKTKDRVPGMLYLFNDSLLLTKSLLRGELLEFVSFVNLFGCKLEASAVRF